MADLLNVMRNMNRFTPSFKPADLSPRFGKQAQTEADMAIMPYINQAKGEYEQDKSKNGFLWKLFDILQTGNYMSANVFDSIYDSAQQKKPLGTAVADALDAAWKGLSHQEKNTFSDVIKQNIQEYGEFLGKDEAQWLDPIIKGKEEDPETRFAKLIDALRQKITPAGVVGLGADIALDPLTYINPLSWFSSTKGASQAALRAGTKYADDVVRLNLLNKNISTLKNIVGSEDVAKQVKKVLDSGDLLMPELEKIIASTGNVQFSRYLDDIVRSAKKKGILTPAAQLGDEMTDEIGKVTKQFSDLVQSKWDEKINTLASEGKSYDEALQAIDKGIGYEPPAALSELTQRVGQGYEGAGTRAFRSAFGEYGVREGKPNALARSFDRFGEMLGDTPAGAKLSDAWWSFMNSPKSPVGFVKKSLGVKNPYQKILHQRVMDAQTYGHSISAEYVPRTTKALDSLGDLQEKALKVRAGAEAAESKVRRAKTGTILNTTEFVDQNKKLLERLGVTPEEADTIKRFWADMDGMLETIRASESKLIEKKLLPGYPTIINYMPKYQQDLVVKGGKGKMLGTAAPGFTEATKYTTEQSVKQMGEQYRLLYGDIFNNIAEAAGRKVDDVISDYIVDNNIAPIGLDLAEMYNRRIVAHARAMQRGKMVEELREFGIRIDDLGISTADFEKLDKTLLKQGVKRPGGGLQGLGLQNVQDEAFKGYLFDDEMAEIINRTYQAASSDEAISTMKKVIGGATSLWKGWATLSTGFHVRNHVANDFTGFMRHGMDWFNPQKYTEGFIMAYYATNPEKYADLIAKNMDAAPAFVAKTLNRQVGNTGMDVKSLIDFAKEKGLVGWGTFFTDVEKQVASPRGKKVLNAFNPLSQDNLMLKGSRVAGDLLETKAKMQSFIMSVEQLAKGELDEGIAKIPDALIKNASILEWAKMDTQKWFINYNDLSEFERKYLRPYIPFYTWLRKNLANQLNAITMFPGVYGIAADVTKEFTLEGFPMALQPEWQKDMGYIPVAEDREGNAIMMFPNLPYQDLNKIPLEWEPGKLFPRLKGDDVWEELMANAHPFIKTVIEHITKTNTFKKREYLDHVAAPGVAQFLGKSPKIVGALDGMLRMAGFENGMRISERNGRVEIDEQIERVLTTNLPGLRALEKVIDAGLDVADMINPGIEAAVTAATGRKDDYEGLEDMLQRMSYFGGIKFKTFQEEFEREQANEEIEARAQELQREERRRLPGYDQRVRDYLQQQEDRYRRRGLY